MALEVNPRMTSTRSWAERPPAPARTLHVVAVKDAGRGLVLVGRDVRDINVLIDLTGSGRPDPSEALTAAAASGVSVRFIVPMTGPAAWLNFCPPPPALELLASFRPDVTLLLVPLGPRDALLAMNLVPGPRPDRSRFPADMRPAEPLPFPAFLSAARDAGVEVLVRCDLPPID